MSVCARGDTAPKNRVLDTTAPGAPKSSGNTVTELAILPAGWSRASEREALGVPLRTSRGSLEERDTSRWRARWPWQREQTVRRHPNLTLKFTAQAGPGRGLQTS